MSPASTFGTTRSFAAAVILAAGLACGVARAQSGESAPAAAPAPVAQVDANGRRLMTDEPTVLAFKNVPVDQVMMFIVETTGKAVLPQPDILTRRITVLNDQPISRARALDLVFFALQQNGIAVVEMPDLILLRDIGEIDRQDVPVLGPDVRVRNRTDMGTIVEKVFSLRRGSAENVGEILKTSVPNYAKLSVDVESNQIIVMGNIGLLQRMETLIEALDQAGADSLSTETFHLRYADAEQVATNIKELYSAQQRTGAQGGGQPQNPFQQFFQRGGGGGGGGPGGQGGNQGRGGQGGNNQNRPGGQGGGGAAGDQSLSANIRVTASKQQNSITVLAERQVLDQVRTQILDSWDKPLPPDDVIPRVYELKNSDPIKIRDVLREIFGQPQGQAGGGGGGASTQGVGRLAGQFSFEAIPESSKLLVMTKSPDNFSVIDDTIAQLDLPQTAGLPRIVELKHASAEELAEQLNALLSQEGTLAQIPRQESGLSEDTAAASPFAADQTAQQTNQQTQAAAGTITFWWQRARPPTTTAGASNLVSKIRIVPVWRQNALMILSPPEYQQSVAELIQLLDQPGRQVLLSAVIAEISMDDETALGIRWSSSAISPTNPDNALAIGANQAGRDAGGIFTGTQNNLLPGLFDTSVLNVGVDLNVLLQALAQKTKINILSEPRIFTSDNQEAEFFAGQDIPFVTDSQTTDNGTLNQSFDYRAVGIQLRVRPRITVKRDVDLRINLELSSIQPNQTLFGGFIVDRRETTTHLIVQDGQTVVVSGILRTEDSDVKRKVPLLGDIPLIGGLFTSTEKTKSRTELVAFITPIVIENPEQADKASEADRAHLRELHNELSPSDAGPEAVAPAAPIK